MTGWKPRRSRMGRLSSEASTCSIDVMARQITRASDETAMLPDDPQQRAVLLDPRAQRGKPHPTQVLIIGGQQIFTHPPRLTTPTQR